MAEQYPFVIVEWDDAWQDQENFATAHGIATTHQPMRVKTRGLLILDDDVGISLANEDSVQDGTPVFRGRTFVPRAMVRSVTPYNLTKPRTKRRAAPAETPLIDTVTTETPLAS